MDFINIAIPSVTSILCIIISWVLNSRTLTKKVWEIREEQLRKIYMPMELLLQSTCSAKEKVHSAQLIIKQNYLLAPPVLLKEVNQLNLLPSLEDDDLTYLSRIVATHYEWTRKSLKYPYDPKRIERKLKPTYELLEKIGSNILSFTIIMWLSSLCFLIDTTRNKTPVPNIVHDILVAFVLLVLCAIMLWGIYIMLSQFSSVIKMIYSSLKNRFQTSKDRDDGSRRSN